MTPDQLVERDARQEWHDEERLLLSAILTNAEIIEINNIRMPQLPKDSTLPPKQIYLLRIE